MNYLDKMNRNRLWEMRISPTWKKIYSISGIFYILRTPPSLPPVSPIWPFLRLGCILEQTASHNHHLLGGGHDAVVVDHAFTELVIAVIMANSLIELYCQVFYMAEGICCLICSQYDYIYWNKILFASKQNVIVNTERKAWKQ